MKDGDLDIIRRKIDMIDWEMMQLLSQRMEISVRSRKLKRHVLDPAREQQIIENVKKYSYGLVDPEFSEGIYRQILEESRNIQEKNVTLIGFQGEHGAYSEAASLTYNPSFVALPCKEFYEVFHEVATGQLDLGIVPVENSLEGPVTQVNDLLIETELKIIGEIKIPVHHSLLALPETEYRDLKIVYSHPQALAQCREFISRHKLEPRRFYDTAGAAKMLSDDRPDATCVIANKLCAELYHLEIIQENVEDHESNSTRFVILSRDESPEPGDKCSIIFSLKHEAGALFSILKIFSDNVINLTRIESRPFRSDPGNYVFFTDFEGSDKDKKVMDVLKAIQEKTKSYKFCGCYPSYKETVA
jgi:prephenate dehydratase/chorismate mutase/prephenate dehydratase